VPDNIDARSDTASQLVQTSNAHGEQLVTTSCSAINKNLQIAVNAVAHLELK